ncbi:MAG: class I SAM-dependent methyltransferase [Ferruginibacter sp.]
MKYEISEKIKEYYDNASIEKIRDFINGNERAEKAWNTISTYALNPSNILEIGCGIGAMCNRCNLTWPDAQIIGIDISAKSIKVAKNLFESEKCQFYTDLPRNKDKAGFDLILLIDVIEHVEKHQRQQLIDFIKENLSENGMLILAFPTPHMLDINRQYFPEKLQPVEENIFISDLQHISQVISKPLVLYKEIFVWQKRDYAHAIFSEQLIEDSRKSIALRKQLINKIKSLYPKVDIKNINKSRKEFVLKKMNLDLDN